MTEPDPTPDQIDSDGSDTQTSHAESKNSTDPTSRSGFTRREVIGTLAAAGVIGATASAQSSGDAAASVGGGPMSDPLSEFTVKEYAMTWQEFQNESAGVQDRVVRIVDDGNSHHGELYHDDGASWNLLPVNTNAIVLEDTA